MCDHREEIKKVHAAMAGKSPQEYINNKQMAQIYNPDNVKQEHCMCGNWIEPARISGSFPRYLCDTCFPKLTGIRSKKCRMCGKDLTPYQQKMSERYPRELQYAFCEGQGNCWEHFLILGAKTIMGDDRLSWGVSQNQHEVPALLQVFGSHNDTAIPALPEVCNPVSSLPELNIEPLALPEPQPQDSLDIWGDIKTGFKSIGDDFSSIFKNPEPVPVLATAGAGKGAKYQIIDV